MRKKSETYLHASFLLPAKLDLAKLSLANGVAQDELAKPGRLLTPGVVVATSSASPSLVHLVGRGNDGGRGRIIIVLVFRGLV